jgi:RIO kinase 1
MKLTGIFAHDDTPADVDAVMLQIEEARKEAEIRQRGREEANAAPE